MLRFFFCFLVLLLTAVGCERATAPESWPSKVVNLPEDQGAAKPDASQASLARSYAWLCQAYDAGIGFSNLDWLCNRIRLGALAGRVWPEEPCKEKGASSVKDAGSREGYKIVVYTSACGNYWFQFQGASHQFLLGPLGICGYQAIPITVQH